MNDSIGQQMRMSAKEMREQISRVENLLKNVEQNKDLEMAVAVTRQIADEYTKQSTKLAWLEEENERLKKRADELSNALDCADLELEKLR